MIRSFYTPKGQTAKCIVNLVGDWFTFSIFLVEKMIFLKTEKAGKAIRAKTYKNTKKLHEKIFVTFLWCILMNTARR